MIFSMYITIPVILGVVITVLLGLMTVEKKIREWIWKEKRIIKIERGTKYAVSEI